jgi:fatty-acyl-CoA synthase
VSNINTGSLVDVQRRRRPDALALVSQDESCTYGELAERVHAFADRLREAGLGRGDRIAFLGGNSINYVVALMAVYRVGAIAVTLNVRLQVDELDYLFHDSGAIAALVDAEMIGVAEKVCAGHDLRLSVCLDRSGLEGWPGLDDVVEAHRGAEVPVVDVAFDDPQRILYTSGTTSRPKGVVITHGMVLCNMLGQTSELKLTSGDVVLVSSPLFHVAAIDAPGFTALFLGGTLVLMRKFDARSALELIQEHRVTGGIFAQSILHAFRQVDHSAMDLTSVRWVIFGAGAGELYADIRSLFGDARLVQAYGMTEACSTITCVPEEKAHEHLGTLGKAVDFLELQIVDPAGNPVGTCVEGEIVLRGPKVSPRYWAPPEKAQQPRHDGWLHTGDGGFLDENGNLTITDRLKDMIRSGGENVGSMEIERVIYGHPAVYEAAVVGMPDPKWQEVPKAYVVLKPGASLSEAELLEYCRGRLAGFKTPKAVEFIPELPRHGTGKVLKRALRERARQET